MSNTNGQATLNGLGNLLAAVEYLRTVHREMPAQQVAMLLLVAQQPGITMPELGEKLDMPQGSVSRNVASLSKFQGLNKPGDDLVVADELPEDRRVKTVTLTRKGERVVAKLAEILSD